MTNLLINILKGSLYGIFSVIPGLSGGIIANYFGDYTKCIEIILGERSLLSNLKYVVSIFFGFLLGVLLSSNVIVYLYSQYTVLFISFVILSNLYILFKTLQRVKIELKFLLLIIFITITLIFFMNQSIVSINNKKIVSGFIVSSVLYSMSKVIPGISSTSILINIGFYETLMKFFVNPFFCFFRNPFFWFFFWLLFVLFSYIFLKLANKLIKSKVFDYFIIIILIFNLLTLILKCCI